MSERSLGAAPPERQGMPGLPSSVPCINVLSRYYIGPAVKSHRGISQRQEAAAERALFQAVLTLRSIEECRDFFRDLCTPCAVKTCSGKRSRA